MRCFSKRFRLNFSDIQVLVLPLLVLLIVSHLVWAKFGSRIYDDLLIRETATSIANGDGYTACVPINFPFCSSGDPTAARDPLPILLLAVAHRLLGAGAVANLMLNTLLDLGTGVVIFFIALRLFNDRRVGLIALAMWAVYPPLLRLVASYRLEPTLSLALALALLTLMIALEKPAWQRFALAGAFLGLAILSRSVLLFLLPLFPLATYFAFQRKLRPTVLRSAAYILSAAIVIAPWALRSTIVLGRFPPTSTLNGYNLFRHNYIIAGDDLFKYPSAEETYEVLTQALSQRTDVRGDENENEMDRLYTSMALDIIKAHPFQYLLLTAYRFLFVQWFDMGPAGPGPAGTYNYSPVFHVFLIVSNLTLLPLATWEVVRLRRARWALAWPIIGMFVFLSIVYPPVTTQTRFFIPVMPYVFMFAGQRLLEIKKKTQ